MTALPTQPVLWISPLDSPAAYAVTACARLAHRNLSAYAALICAVALPSLVWLMKSLVGIQGRELAGAAFEARFETAAVAMTGLAAAVGWLQVQLLLGRLTERRLGELRLVMLMTGSLRAVRTLMLAEALVNAMIGWIAGTLLSLCLAMLIVVVEATSLPSPHDIAIAIAVGLAVAITGILVPTLGVAMQLARLDTPTKAERSFNDA